jgi:hypothetical protein
MIKRENNQEEQMNLNHKVSHDEDDSSGSEYDEQENDNSRNTRTKNGGININKPKVGGVLQGQAKKTVN